MFSKIVLTDKKCHSYKPLFKFSKSLLCLKRDLVLSDEAELIIRVPEESRALVDLSSVSNKSESRYAFLS